MQSIDSRDSNNDTKTRRLIEAYLGIEDHSFSGLTNVICILFSAKLGQPVNSAQKNYVEIFHQLYVGNNRKNLILMFLIIAKTYGHEIAFNGMALKEDKISHKKKEILRSLKADKASSPYAPDRKLERVLEKAFPEAFGKYLKFCTDYGLFSRPCLDDDSKA